uniref:Phospholipase B1, membrane-associated n=1 Tax=Xiphophorus couchianus TaxID=32473 RepID=A0A3B5LD53_9TELE
MEALLIAVACALLSCSVKDDWWGEYQEGIRHYSDEDLNKTFPEKTRPMRFKHPPFQCPDMTPSATVPTSEFVKAADIKVIAALGDSVTTAVGANATTVLEIPVEFRHVSWIGGYGTFQDVITLAIIKLFNPTLLGASPGKTIHGKGAHISETGFNLAVTGHNTNLPDQTRELIDTLRRHEGLNFDEDWKLLTILIGMNDICDYCKDKALYSVDNFIHYMTLSLEMLMNEFQVPRMIVNVVQILRMHFLREVQRPTPGCRLQSFCPCLIEPVSNSPELEEVIEINLEFQRRLEKLLHSDRFLRKDFAVVLQPFLKHADSPRLPNGNIDMTFFTHDCFHVTIKGQEELAKGLWNNMFQPEGGKMIVSSFSEPLKLICPPEVQEHPYIFIRPVAAKSSPSLLHSKSTSPAAVILL